MKTIQKGNDFIPAIAKLPRQLEQRLVGLAAGIAEEYLAWRADKLN